MKCNRLSFFFAGMFLGFAFLFQDPLPAAGLGWCFCFLLSELCRRNQNAGAIEFWIAGIGAQATGFFWLQSAVAHYGGYSPALSIVLWTLSCMLAALPNAFSGFLYQSLNEGSSKPSPLWLALSWLSGECLIPVLFPWNLAHTQLGMPFLPQTADLLGVPFVSALMLFWSAGILSIAVPSSAGRSPADAMLALSILISLVLSASYSFIRSKDIRGEISAAKGLNIGIIQPNFDPAKDFRPENMNAVLQFERDLSRPLIENGNLDLLAWPESSVWSDYPDRARSIKRGIPDDPFQGITVPVIFGGQSSEFTPPGVKPKIRNSVFLIDRNGVFAGRYHKRMLFPFSEKIPFQETFPVLERFNQKEYSVPAGSLLQPAVALELITAGAGRRIPFGVAICYEDIWPGAFRSQVAAQEVEVLFSFTNDAWFLRSPAVWEHHLVASWRAIELRRYLVRVTMDGMTAVVDPFGKSVESVPAFTPAAFVSKEVRPLRGRSLFSRVGELPLMIVSLMTVIAVVWRRRGRKR